MIWEIAPCSHLSGRIAVPGSKSHTIRAVAAALLAEGTSEIYAPLYSADTQTALNAVRALGAVVDETPSVWKITGCGKNFTPVSETIDLGNSGTTMRIITAVSALGKNRISFDGDASLRTRIMAGLLTSLSELGAVCSSSNGFAPLSVQGPLQGGCSKVDGTTSQYLTALLMSLVMAEKDSILTLDFLNEADYVRITLDWLKRCGIKVKYSDDLLRFEIPGNQHYQAFSRVIPADFSTAAFPLGAGVIAGEEIRIANLDFDDLQGDKKVFDFVRKMNGDVSIEKDEVVVRKSKLTGGVFDLNATPDALPVMAVLGCYAQGDTSLVNVPQARLKECDRIACMTRELRKMGAEIEELEDGMIIHGGKELHGAFTDSYGDHRIAMALTVAALGASGKTFIKDGECCQVTYPAFADDFAKLGTSIKESVQ